MDTNDELSSVEMLINLVKKMQERIEIESAVRTAYSNSLRALILTLYEEKGGKEFAEEIGIRMYQAAYLNTESILKKKGIDVKSDIQREITDLLSGLNISAD